MAISDIVGSVTSRANFSALVFAARINIFGFSLAALWTPLDTLLLPNIVTAHVPRALEGSALGLITFLGVGIAALVEPIAGRASDRAPLHDRRKPFILFPVMLAIPAVFALLFAPNFLWLLAVYVLLQVVMNIGQAAFQALIPDLIKRSNRGLASGVKSSYTVIGDAVGLAGVSILAALSAPRLVQAGFLALMLALGAFLDWAWVPRVPPLSDQKRVHSWPALLSLGALRHTFGRLIAASRSFQLAVAMRFLFLLGAYPVQTFLLYYLESRFGIRHPILHAGILLLGGVALAAVGAGVGGALSDRVGHKPILWATVALLVPGLLGMAFAPNIPTLVVPGAMVAVALGAFEAANWALLSDFIPTGRGAQYFGFANIATAGASALAGAFGPVVDLAHAYLPADSYTVVFSLAALVALLSILPLRALNTTSNASTS